MQNEVIPAISLLAAIAAVLFTLWQGILQKRAIQAQVFLHMLDQSTNSAVTDGLRLLAALKQYDDYAVFKSQETPENQAAIYHLVDFLDITANLVENGSLPRQRVWDLYFMPYRIAHKKLLPWWLDGERQEGYHQRFSHFERMCNAIASISDDAIKRFDKKRSRRAGMK